MGKKQQQTYTELISAVLRELKKKKKTEIIKVHEKHNLKEQPILCASLHAAELHWQLDS